MMRFSTLMIGLSATALAYAAHAQETQAPPSDVPATQQGPSSDAPPPPTDGGATVTPQGAAPDAAVPPAPSAPPAAYNATPAGPAPAGQPVMGQQEPVVQAAPQPPTDYPLCSKSVKDGCKNPGSK